MSRETPRRTRLAEARQARINRPEVAGAYEQTRLRYELGEAVRLRREELGWSQRQLAERAGMSQCGQDQAAIGHRASFAPGRNRPHGGRATPRKLLPRVRASHLEDTGSILTSFRRLVTCKGAHSGLGPDQPARPVSALGQRLIRESVRSQSQSRLH